jgi:hypothetical protein
MPLHVAPPIRALEEAEEAVGLIQKLDSDAVIQEKILESEGYPKPLVGEVIYINGTVYTVAAPVVPQQPLALTLQLGETINNWSDHM